MSKFIIGNKPIKSVSGPVRVCILKPDIEFKKRFEEEGGRLPYIILFGDYHFGREGKCEKCDCNTSGDCCYEIDDPEFLKLFDGLATKNFPIDFYTEELYEQRLSDPDIYNINESINRQDRKGYLSKFLHEYRTCYSKKDRRTKKYKEECPTRDLRWHYIDTRKVEYGNSGEAFLYKGIKEFFSLLFFYFNKDKPEHEDASFNEGRKAFIKYTKEFTMVFDIIRNGPEFLNKYLTKDSNFLVAKQVKKQVIPELKDIELWKKIMFDTINQTFHDYIGTSPDYTVDDYVAGVEFYKNILALISDNKISKEDFLKERKELMKNVEKYDLFGEDLINLQHMYSLTTATSMMDIYTITRMLKKPENGVPGFCSMFYAGDLHVKNIINILTRYFGYSIIGQSMNENLRCQDVSNIDFNLFKVKQEYK